MDYIKDPLSAFGGSFIYMTIEKAIEDYLLWKSTYASTAAIAYERRLRHFKSAFGKDRDLKTISVDDIIKYRLEMASAKIYSDKTIEYSCRIIKDFLSFWHGRRAINLNPDEIKVKKIISKPRVVCSEEDFAKMCATLNENDPRELCHLLALHMLWDSGMRVSELCHLKFEDLEDFEKMDNKEIGTAQLQTKKSHKYNLIAWSNRTNELLNKYSEIRSHIYPKSEYVIMSLDRPKGKRTRRTTIGQWVKKAVEKAGVAKGISPHSFRHGKAHDMLNKGAPLVHVNAIMRHSSLSATLHYQVLNSNQFRNVAAQYLN